MAGYNEIKGLRVKYLSADPSNAENGQVWYNSTTGNLRVQGIGVGAWSSSASLGTGRYTSGSFGNQTAGVVVGGSASGSKLSNVEHYNGTGFSSATAFPAGINSGSGAGTQTAGLIAGGNSPSRTNAAFEYDGSSWTATNNLPGAMDNLANCGTETQSNVIMAVGRTPASGNSGTNQSVTYDGTNFASGPNHVTTRMFNTVSGAGTGTAGLIIGGFIDPSPNAMTNCEEYDGSAWATTGSLNVATGFATAFGTQTNAVTQVNSPNYEGSEQYNGSTWAALPNIGITSPGGLYGSSAGATGDAGWISSMSPTYNKTAEWNFTTNTVTPAAWASAPSIGTGRYLGGYGITPTNASIIFGGQSATGSVANTEEYNGSSWAENPDMNTARSRINGFGTQTAAVTMGGRQVGVPPNISMNNTELYDGSSWTNGPAYPLTARGIGGAGTNAAGLAIAAWTGSPPGFTTCNDWNGSGWTAAEANLNTARGYVSGWGTQSDAGAAGGPPANTDYEEYNGSSWTTKASLVSATGAPSGGAAGFGGTPGAIKANGNGGTFSQEWNGTSWGTAVSRANTNYGGGMSGGNTAASGIVTGGYIYPSTGPANASEEFTGETVAAAPASTLTTS